MIHCYFVHCAWDVWQKSDHFCETQKSAEKWTEEWAQCYEICMDEWAMANSKKTTNNKKHTSNIQKNMKKNRSCAQTKTKQSKEKKYLFINKSVQRPKRNGCTENKKKTIENNEYTIYIYIEWVRLYSLPQYATVRTIFAMQNVLNQKQINK